MLRQFAAIVLVALVLGACVSTTAPAPQSTITPTPIPAATSLAGVGRILTRTIDGMVMAYVPSGTFKMGSETDEDNEKPVHDVTLDAFWIDRTEVTNAQYAKCVTAGKCDPPSQTKSYTRNSYYDDAEYADYPVIWVNWTDARNYCIWAGGHLPTEAQWEYAARGPYAFVYPWGNDPPNSTLLNYKKEVGDTTKVGAYPKGASWVGAFDLAGNVFEWIRDWYREYPASAQINPLGPTSGYSPVMRGGSWWVAADLARAAFRHSGTAFGSDVQGFRCAVGLDASAVNLQAPTIMPQPTITPVYGIRPIDDMVMVQVPGGTFKMGSESGEEDERPARDVTLDAFWIDRTEVTNAQYAKCVSAGQCDPPSQTQSYTHESYYADSQHADYPVVNVSWYDAANYCNWAGGHLPTEAQWEYAARGPNAYAYPWGNTFEGKRLSFCDENCSFRWGDRTVDDGYAETSPVESHPSGSSWIGALDLAGNVWEWIQDWYGTYPTSAQMNPPGPDSGVVKVVRGGSWYNSVDTLRMADRNFSPPDLRTHLPYTMIGIRCVATSRTVTPLPPDRLPTRAALPGTATPAPRAVLTQTPVAGSRTRAVDGMIMVKVPGGTFKMGSESGEDDERPVHDVALSEFWIDRTEVTNAQYATCVTAGKCAAPPAVKSATRNLYYGTSQYADYPVISVSWKDAADYCRWVGGQLPTEAQWEYAARGPNGYTYPWGNTFDGTRLNFCDKNCLENWADQSVDDGYTDTAPVGSYPSGASWIGALDLAGNVWEWVQDGYGPYPASSQIDPIELQGAYSKVVRGRSYFHSAAEMHATERSYNGSDGGLWNLGFRCVATGAGE